MVHRRLAAVHTGNRAVYRLRHKLRDHKRRRHEHEGALPLFPQPYVCILFPLLFRLCAADPLAAAASFCTRFSDIITLDHPLRRTLVRAEVRGGVCAVYGAGGKVCVDNG